MANRSILYLEPQELTITQFRELSGWSMAKLALELGQSERTLYDLAKKDSRDKPHYTMIRKHLALIYKASLQASQ